MDLDLERLLALSDALNNKHRLRILAALQGGREYVSELARRLDLSRPLLYMHLSKLEEAGLVGSEMELSEDGKAMKFYHVNDFRFELDPQLIARAVEAHPDPEGL